MWTVIIVVWWLSAVIVAHAMIVAPTRDDWDG